MNKKNDFRAVVAAIKEKVKPGDIANICRKGNFSSQTFRKAMKAESWEALTAGELHAMENVILFFEEREELIKRAEAFL
ncbi:MAG: hypothetical protein LBH60_05420 [Prevotellaceae bacterium]|jgi:hypothetical protein|nr:hypothetical protein [Prevotellaceae bacterium]